MKKTNTTKHTHQTKSKGNKQLRRPMAAQAKGHYLIFGQCE